MASRRRSNRIVLQEVIEESRKEAEEAMKSQQQQQQQQQQPLEDDDETTGGRRKDRGDGGKSGEGRRTTSGSSRSPDDDAAVQETGRKRLRKLNDATSKKSHVSKKARTADGDDDDVVVLSDGFGDADLENSDASSGDAGRGIARKASRSSSRDVVRKSHKRRPRSIHDDDDDGDSQNGSEGNDEADAEDEPVDRKRSQPTTTVNSKSSSSVSIPKKAIPRRKPDASSGQDPSSLLAHMKPAYPSVDPHLPQGSSRHHPSSKFKTPAGPATTSLPTAAATTKTCQDPHASSASSAAPSQRMSPKQDSTAESAGPAITKRFMPPKPSQSAPASSKPAERIPKQHVLDDLGRLCHSLADDARFALPPMASIDLSGSFLGDDDRYDFFDTDQFGEIVFQPKVPIFPEEFPPGMAEHSLSWWGVLDPALGDGKFKAQILHGADSHPHPSAPSNSAGAGPGPGHAGFQQSQWNYQPPNLQPQRSGQMPQWTAASQPQPGMNPQQGRGPNSWTPPLQGPGGRGGGGGGNPQPPSNNRRFTPPRSYDRR